MSLYVIQLQSIYHENLFIFKCMLTHIEKSLCSNIRFLCPYLLLRNLLKHVKIDLKKSELVKLLLRCVSMTLNEVLMNIDCTKIFYL